MSERSIPQIIELADGTKCVCLEDFLRERARADEAIRERNELRELVKAYQDYTQLLGDEISDTAAVAYLHGWRSSRYEQGKVLREKIKQLEGAK